MSEATTDLRLERLEADVHEMKATLGRLEPLIIRIDATLPHLATKAEVAELRTAQWNLATRAEMVDQLGSLRAELADKPGRAFLAGAIAVLLAAYALGLAGLAALPALRALGGGH